MAPSSEKKTRGYIPPSTDEERLVARRAQELARAACFGGAVRTMGFLSDRELSLAQAATAHSGAAARAFGGYEGAERTVLAFAGSEEQLRDEVFDIAQLRVTAHCPPKPLTHRDYLGALLSLGLKRESVGDILPDESGAFVYARGAAAKLILQELASVGRCSVSCEASAQSVQAQTAGEERRAFVASLRLDAVLAAVLHISRGDAAALVKAGAVSVNHIEMTRASSEMFEGDVLRVRGYGKFSVRAVGPQSKKGRTAITYCQY